MATYLPPDRSKMLSAPVPLTPLNGREHKVALALARLRRPDVHLLTRTGPGGIGKTTLSRAIAAETGTDFTAGVYFVPLAGISHPGSVVTALARATSLAEASDTLIRDTLAAYLGRSRSLLVLDNFEHLPAATQLVSELLALCPGLTVLDGPAPLERLRLMGSKGVVDACTADPLLRLELRCLEGDS